MDDFRGKVVVVTGAASGIGREIALAFARRGAGLSRVRDELASIDCEEYTEVVDVSKAGQVEEFGYKGSSEYEKEVEVGSIAPAIYVIMGWETPSCADKGPLASP